MSTSPLTFTGVSTFSSDFQAIMNRAVSIAQIPITILQNHQSDNNSKVQLLTGLSSAVATLGTTIAALGNIGSTKGLSASSSDSSTVSVTNTGATQSTSYTISNITSLASAASGTTLNGYADSTTAAVSSTGSMQLILGSTAYSLTLDAKTNNLAGLRDAINGSGAGVTATILTTGTGATPNYLVVSANNGGATTLQVNDLPAAGAPMALLNGAQPLAESSLTSYANTGTTAVSANGSLNLVINGTTTAITLAAGQNNLTGLAAAITASGAGVTATVANAGSGVNPYSLVITANNLGATSLQLNDVPAAGSAVNLMSAVNNNANQGSSASFELNGIPVTRSSNLVNDVIPGLTFNLLQVTTGSHTNSGTVTLSLTSNSSSLSSALSDLANNYNAVQSLLTAQSGPNSGLLNGDHSVLNIANDLQQLAMYQAPGSNNTSLASLGVTFSTTGNMSFDPTALSGFSESQLASAFSFLGSATTGLGAIAHQLTQLTDPVTGTIKAEQAGLKSQNTDLSSHITTLNDRLNAMETALNSQLGRADAAVAKLQSQQSVLTGAVQSVDLALYGQNFGTATASGH